jgi:hypothetical protein
MSLRPQGSAGVEPVREPHIIRSLGIPSLLSTSYCIPYPHYTIRFNFGKEPNPELKPKTKQVVTSIDIATLL